MDASNICVGFLIPRRLRTHDTFFLISGYQFLDGFEPDCVIVLFSLQTFIVAKLSDDLSMVKTYHRHKHAALGLS